MRYLSVCSGIEAASVAFGPHGWEPVAFSEIDRAASSVLAHHYPGVPNWGDMSKFQEWPDADVDVLCGGTPCQSFSVAGLRKGLADPRGNLMLTFGAIAGRYRPRWLVWENVPGVLSSNGGRDFGAFLGMLGELGYGFAYRVLDAQHVRTRRFPSAVPQRRRRVFVVGYLGDWRRAAAVLFDRESLSGNPPPRREAGKGIAADAAQGVAIRGREGGGTAELTGPIATALRAAQGGGDKPHVICADAAPTLNANFGDKQGLENQHINGGCGLFIAEPVAIQGRAVSENPDAGQQGAGFRDDGAAYTLEARHHVQAVAFSCKDHGADAGEIAPTMRAMGHGESHANAGGQLAIATPYAVRRLTPRECERLMGFPSDYTLVPNGRGGLQADGPRYKQLGNSWAINCVDWIAERIAIVDKWGAVPEQQEARNG